MVVGIGSIGSATYGLVFQLLMGLVVIVILAALFFGTRFIMRWRKRKKNFKITAVIANTDGSFYTKKIGKFKTSDGIDKMLFEDSNETCPVIPVEYIKSNTVCLWRYGVGQYAVVHPRSWGQDPKNFKIDIIDMQMKNFAFLEQRAAVSRWAYVKDILMKWAPFITVVIICILAGVAVWFMMKTGSSIYKEGIAARIMECKQALGLGSAAPTG